jgi:hypothetical protein
MLRRVAKRTRAAVGALALAVLSVVALAPAGPAGAQVPGASEPTIADMALAWARGRFASPVICQFGDRPVRGIRRVLITPGPARVQPPVDRILFVDLDVNEASRCFAELAGDVPNVVGWVQIRLPGTFRPDLAQREFREQLRRKQGFEFEIPAGGLKLQTVTQPPTPARTVDFAGGTASLREIDPRSDTGRLLAQFSSPRKLLLELSARDGTKLSFPLYMTDSH